MLIIFLMWFIILLLRIFFVIFLVNLLVFLFLLLIFVVLLIFFVLLILVVLLIFGEFGVGFRWWDGCLWLNWIFCCIFCFWGVCVVFIVGWIFCLLFWLRRCLIMRRILLLVMFLVMFLREVLILLFLLLCEMVVLDVGLGRWVVLVGLIMEMRVMVCFIFNRFVRLNFVWLGFFEKVNLREMVEEM